jgi:hypothetical protein
MTNVPKMYPFSTTIVETLYIINLHIVFLILFTEAWEDQEFTRSLFEKYICLATAAAHNRYHRQGSRKRKAFTENTL